MSRYFLSQPVFSSPQNIDAENGIITGITVAKTGLAKGHNGNIDKAFLLQLVELAAKRPQGIKARFGHPNMCSTALGTYLGRFHNYAFHPDKVTADLHLDPSAKSSPQGNLFDYVLEMAANNPDMFGASVVFEAADFMLSEEDIDGKKSKIKNFRIKELRATDIVDEPAATDALFSADTMPGQATLLLDQNPDLAEFIFSKPESVIEFLNTYLNNSSMNLSEKIKTNFRKLFNLDNNFSEPEIQTPVLNPEPEPEPIALEATEAEIQAPEPIKAETATEFDFDAAMKRLDATIELLNQMANENSSLKSKLAASPSIPKQVSDPQVTLNLSNPVKDETGKQILQALPPDLRYHLRKNSKINT